MNTGKKTVFMDGTIQLKTERKTDMKYGSMSIVTTNKNHITKKKWLHGQWTDNAQDFWDDFSSDGKLDEEEEIEAKGCDLLDHYDFSFLNLKGTNQFNQQLRND